MEHSLTVDHSCYKMEFLIGLMMASLIDTAGTCTTGIFAQTQPRTVTWTPEFFQQPGSSPSKMIPLLFQPSSFAERLGSADFTLISASLLLPCIQPDRIEGVDPEWEIVILPEVWLQYVPILLGSNASHVKTICDLFRSSNTSLSAEHIPGCQDWSRLEAWKRLRIFYDIRTPVTQTLHKSDYTPYCPIEQLLAPSRTWNVDVTRIIQTWLRNRDPWARINATLPIILLSKQSRFSDYRPAHVQVQLQLIFWMDSKLEYFFSLQFQLLLVEKCLCHFHFPRFFLLSTNCVDLLNNGLEG